MRRLLTALTLAISLIPAVGVRATPVMETGASVTTAGPAVIRDHQAGMHTLKAVGQQQQDTAIEPSVAVNPGDPLNAVIGYQAGRVDGGCAQTLGYGVTFDGGETWSWGPLPKLTTANGGTYPLASDPVIAFGPSNTVYYSELLCSPSDLATSVSHDGGKTWSDPIVIPSAQTFASDDKNWIVVDNGTGVGHHPGRIYLGWDDVEPVVALYSDDEAKTWNGPYVIYPYQGIGTLPMVMPNGDLSVVLNTGTYVNHLPSDQEPETDFVGAEMIVATAKGAGAVPTGGPLVFTVPLAAGSDRSTDVPLQRAGEGLPSAAFDPRNARIYVAWQDGRFRSDGSNDIVISWSDTTGVTWNNPVRVNPGPTGDGVEHFTPALGVGPDGSVRISYRVQEEGSDFVDTAYQQSTDGGQTWTAPLLVNTGSIPELLPTAVPVRTDIHFAAYSRSSAFLGDYSE
ncbi:MAG: sialidase family protein, partial [Actinomycetota bacterium]